MKRSEAEKLVNDWLDTASVITGKTVIEFVETRLGMIPPEVMTVSPGGTFIDVNGTVHEFDSINTFDNKWELEPHPGHYVLSPVDYNKLTEKLGQQTYCIDCGIETEPGKGSARCRECWKDKTGMNT